MEIPLTKGKVAIIDDSDYALVGDLKWYASMSCGCWYAKRTIRDGSKRRVIAMHRVIFGCQPGEHIDHINGNGLDNRRANLRIASYSQNRANCRGYGASGLKGVYKVGNRWKAQICFNKKLMHIGSYKTKEAAAEAYKVKAVEFFGSFARA